MATDAAHDVHILHQRDRAITAEGVVQAPGDEQSLISIGQGPPAGNAILRAAPDRAPAKDVSSSANEKTAALSSEFPIVMKVRAACSQPAVSLVSAWRNRIHGDSATAAPTASCWPRPVSLPSTCAPHAFATATVRSVDPPSLMIVDFIRPASRAPAKLSNVGITTSISRASHTDPGSCDTAALHRR